MRGIKFGMLFNNAVQLAMHNNKGSVSGADIKRELTWLKQVAEQLEKENGVTD